jgi:hypothetical protein
MGLDERLHEDGQRRLMAPPSRSCGESPRVRCRSGRRQRDETTRWRPTRPQRHRDVDVGAEPPQTSRERARTLRRRRYSIQRFFADARFFGVILNDIPTIVALWRVAPSVRLSDFAIFESGSLRAMFFRRRRSSFDHGRRTGAFLLRVAILATIAPLHISTTGMALCMIYDALQVLRVLRASGVGFLDSNWTQTVQRDASLRQR